MEGLYHVPDMRVELTYVHRLQILLEHLNGDVREN